MSRTVRYPGHSGLEGLVKKAGRHIADLDQLPCSHCWFSFFISFCIIIPHSLGVGWKLRNHNGGLYIDREGCKLMTFLKNHPQCHGEHACVHFRLYDLNIEFNE